jgi:hypothetical protein
VSSGNGALAFENEMNAKETLTAGEKTAIGICLVFLAVVAASPWWFALLSVQVPAWFFKAVMWACSVVSGYVYFVSPAARVRWVSVLFYLLWIFLLLSLLIDPEFLSV